MILPKAVRFIILPLLAVYFFLENTGYTQPTELVLQDVTHRKLSHNHVREKRNAIGRCCATNWSPISVDIVLSLDTLTVDIEPTEFINLLRDVVENFILPFNLTDDLMLACLHFTTACYPDSTGGHQCHCEEPFLWSRDICNTYGACSNTNTQTCNCINGIPSGQFCEPNIDTCESPQPAQLKEVDVVLTVDTPADTEPSDIINLLRDAVDNVSLPFEIADNLRLTNWNLTTGCYLKSTRGHECHCEDSFAWSCDICDTYGACSNASTFTCDCINGIPPFGQFCKPISRRNLTEVPEPAHLAPHNAENQWL
ncbi:uncharacterized protein LOC133417361 [Phycodurus eques]|uniref:uncharacterized protein LOC133417361 n=1 Tax=Phycodurus eques TaxID=693459 RepID=UPI002ACD5171|nr:uncharacterized protein LOC133417361 [Phycodurus eques]